MHCSNVFPILAESGSHHQAFTILLDLTHQNKRHTIDGCTYSATLGNMVSPCVSASQLAHIVNLSFSYYLVDQRLAACCNGIPLENITPPPKQTN